MESKCSDPHTSALAVLCSALCFLLFAFSLLPALSSALLRIPSAFCSLICFCFLLFSIYLFKHSVGSSFRRLCSALCFLLFLPSALLCSIVGCLPFCIKTQMSFPPPENSPPFFQKTNPTKYI